MQVGVTEFLEKVGKLRTDEEKITALKANDTLVLRSILQGAFDPQVKWLIPEGIPNYKPNELVDQEHILINDINKLKYFVDGFYPGLNPVKREMMFIEFLERIDKNDAKMLCQIKDKKWPIKGITVHHVLAAFPDMMPNYEPPVESQEDNKSKLENQTEIVCPHCGQKGTTVRMMNRYHFDNCKQLKTNDIERVPDTVTVEQTADGVYVAPDLTSLQEFKKE